MEKKLTKTILAILIFTNCVFALPNKDFYSDGNIVTGEQWNSVGIYDTSPNHTTVNMTGGYVVEIGTFDASILNMSGGEIGSNLSALEQSTVNISGGTLSLVSSYGTASINLLSNVAIYSMGAYGTSVFNMTGGTIVGLWAEENSMLNLYGGAITDLLVARVSTTVNVFGYNLAKTNIGGTYGDGQVTGFWQNDLPFTINLASSSTYSRINLIPEPATFLLFGLGIFLLRRKH